MCVTETTLRVSGWAEPLKCDWYLKWTQSVQILNPTGANCTQMSTDIHQLTASESNSGNRLLGISAFSQRVQASLCVCYQHYNITTI